MTTQRDVDIAFHRGKERGLAGAPASENPHRLYVRSVRSPLHGAWLAGHEAGLAVRTAAVSA